MKIEELKHIALDALDDLKAQNVVVIDVKDRSTITDFMIVATGTSQRQVKSLANHVTMKAKAAGLQPLGVEGADVGDWVLVDLGDVIVHVMLDSVRKFYQLESLWSVSPKDVAENDDDNTE